jgi:hypothetical protein
VRLEGLGHLKNPMSLLESNPRPSGLQHSPQSTTLPRDPPKSQDLVYRNTSSHMKQTHSFEPHLCELVLGGCCQSAGSIEFFFITTLHGPHGKHRLLLHRIILGVFIAPLHRYGRGADHIENSLSTVEACLPRTRVHRVVA